MANPDLLKHLRDYLIANGVGRDPRVAGAEPPIWLNPRDGAPAPGEKNGVENDAAAMISLFNTGGVVAPPYEQSVWRYETVDIWLRTITAPRANDLDWEIEPLLVDKWNIDIGTLAVIEVKKWRALQTLGFDEASGWTGNVSYIFQLYV